MHRRFWPILLALVATLPLTASANAGTPLMWATMLHLVFGNFLIGIGEGLLLAFAFHLSKWKCMAIMILANYLSAWVGGLWIATGIAQFLPLDLTNAWRWFWIMVVVTYLITLLLEWPFVAWCLRKDTNWKRKSLLADLLVQTASYGLLFGWYWLASGTSLFTRTHVVPPSAMQLPAGIRVYYLNSEFGDIYSRPLNGGEPRHEATRRTTYPDASLSAYPDSYGSPTAHLEVNKQTVLSGLLAEIPTGLGDTRTDHHSLTFSFGPADTLGESPGNWRFTTGFWPVEGLTAKHTQTGKQEYVALETPFVRWDARAATHLPGDLCLFQLGDDQICLYNPNTRQLALLWHGRSPVPVIPRSPASPALTSP